MKSFLMMGQSNMAGRGAIGDVEPIANPYTYMLRMGKWRPMSEPINVDRPIDYSGTLTIYSGVGPAASFADSYAKHYNEKVGLIPCATVEARSRTGRSTGSYFCTPSIRRSSR